MFADKTTYRIGGVCARCLPLFSRHLNKSVLVLGDPAGYGKAHWARLYSRSSAHRLHILSVMTTQTGQAGKISQSFYSASMNSIINMLRLYCAAGGQGQLLLAVRANAHQHGTSCKALTSGPWHQLRKASLLCICEANGSEYVVKGNAIINEVSAEVIF